jgi:hypothetical protein
MCFSEDGNLFAAFDGLFYVWRLPEMKCLWWGHPSEDLFDWELRTLGKFSLIGEHLVVGLHPTTEIYSPVAEYLVVDALTGQCIGKHPCVQRAVESYRFAGRTLIEDDGATTTVYQIEFVS